MKIYVCVSVSKYSDDEYSCLRQVRIMFLFIYIIGWHEHINVLYNFINIIQFVQNISLF